MDDMDELEMELNAPNDNEWNETSFQRRMDTVAHASRNLGALLLKGWTMLADECQICHTPLMSLRGSEPKCVVCHPVEEESKSQPKRSNNTEKRSISKPKLNNIDELKELNELNDKLWNDEEFKKRTKRSEDASAKIGELLLKGWTMLAEHCGKCQTPLMSLRGGKSICCICNNSDQQTIIQPQKHKIQQIQQIIRQKRNALDLHGTEQKKQEKQETEIQNNNDQQPRPSIGINGLNVEQKRNDMEANYNKQDYYGAHYYHGYGSYPPPPSIYGFGPRQDQQLRRTIGDIVKTVLDKMSAINERMKRNNNNLQNDIKELNDLMEFLQNIQKFKTQLGR